MEQTIKRHHHHPDSSQILSDTMSNLDFLEDLTREIEGALELSLPNPYLNMMLHLIRNHFEGKPVTQTSLVAISGVPYATALRRVEDMLKAGLIEQRFRTKSQKTYSLHPSGKMLQSWKRLSNRMQRLAANSFSPHERHKPQKDYYFGNTYMNAQILAAPKILPHPLKLKSGLRILAHGDPTFMAFKNLKRQFELIIGSSISERAFSVDHLRQEILRNAELNQSKYDIMAVNLPWVGEMVTKNILTPLDEIMDIERLDPSDFHPASWQATHWGQRSYGVPSQTGPEIFLYRQDLLANAGLEPPHNIQDMLNVAKAMHRPSQKLYGIAWNAARGTALGYSFLTAMAAFGQPIIALKPIAGGYDMQDLNQKDYPITIDTEAGLEAAEFLLALVSYSPPDILSMSWFERLRAYSEGKVAMSFSYASLLSYFDRDPSSKAYEQTGFAPHPFGGQGNSIATVGGYMLSVPRNLDDERKKIIAEALIALTSAESQKLTILSGSRVAPRYSVSTDNEVRKISPIFDAIDNMAWRDELQFWVRPPIPHIVDIVQICGEELHNMLRGLQSPKAALKTAQKRAEQLTI